METYLVGRSPFADVVIADPSVAENHAEVVATKDGRLYVTDCGTTTGTWRPAADGSGRWEPIRQDFIRAEDPVRVGDHVLFLADVLPSVAPESVAAGPGRGTSLPRGRVERDPLTGEIIRRRG
ncbi:FHA domain-containing protein [Arenibaculum pallidiluteum]|uniref:FHA domain-containing protein n=1 Tax=Arenibaculum pallidiluteum TaxID=2812559 RepID=UPI001A958AB5|nr:FHA domain-containing protein [Arenibaculum pallidiluteum]